MRKQIIKSLFVIGLVAVSVTTAATQALWTDTVTVQNNTFTTGSSELKIYYNELTGGAGECDLSSALAYNADTDSDIDGYVVECDSVANERVALDYGSDTSSDTYDVANHWYDGLSSAIDFTNTYPTWNTLTGAYHATTNSIESGTYTVGAGNILSLVNAGTVPMDITMTVIMEGIGDGETLEPLDGAFPGGDHLDPLVDAAWVTAGLTYTNSLGDDVYVVIELVDAAGSSLATIYQGALGAGTLALPRVVANAVPADAVRFVRFNWEVDEDLTDQSELFDFSVVFDSTT